MRAVDKVLKCTRVVFVFLLAVAVIAVVVCVEVIVVVVRVKVVLFVSWLSVFSLRVVSPRNN